MRSVEHWSRVAELEAMGRAGDRGAVGELVEVLGDDKACWHYKTAAIGALVALGADDAGAAILKTLARDRDPDVRLAAVDALGALRVTKARRLLERLAGGDDAVAARARGALARL